MEGSEKEAKTSLARPYEAMSSLELRIDHVFNSNLTAQ